MRNPNDDIADVIALILAVVILAFGGAYYTFNHGSPIMAIHTSKD